MAQKMPRRNRKAAGIRIKPKEGLWIVYQLRLKGIRQVDLCRKLGITSATMTLAFQGKIKSRRIEETVCKTLGYSSFEAMLDASREKGATV